METIWQNRLKVAERRYKEWENRFKCNTLEEYFEGDQYKIGTDRLMNSPYVTNLVYSTIKIQAANILLSHPKFILSPKPGNSDFSLDAAIQSAQLKEDVLNTIVDNEIEEFVENQHFAFLDSKFRFGVIEVGYSAEWFINPLSDQPLLNVQTEDGKEDSKPKVEREADALPEQERIYIKHIPAKQFRVGANDHRFLRKCDWVGYYEWYYKDDLVAAGKLLNQDALKSASVAPDSYVLDGTKNRIDGGGQGNDTGMVKVWHIWDNRAKRRLMLLDSPCMELWSEDFKRLPLRILRWDIRVKNQGFYPIPPVFQWLSPQNEYNESREMMRNYRKRFLRKFQYTGEKIEQDELDKFTNPIDGEMINVLQRDTIAPITNPPLDASIKDGIIVSKDDFNEVSGTSSADRGRADRTTATESNRLGQKADIRDSAEDAVLNKFLTSIGREIILLAGERFTTGVWAKLQADPGENILAVAQENPGFKYVVGEDLEDGYDFKIKVEIVSDSPDKQEAEKKKFIEFLAICTQFPQIAVSPYLIRQAAYACGFRNERVIQQMQQAAQLAMIGQMQQAQMQGQQQQQPAGPGKAAQGINAQMQPNTVDQVNQQMKNQLLQ